MTFRHWHLILIENANEISIIISLVSVCTEIFVDLYVFPLFFSIHLHLVTMLYFYIYLYCGQMWMCNTIETVSVSLLTTRVNLINSCIFLFVYNRCVTLFFLAVFVFVGIIHFIAGRIWKKLALSFLWLSKWPIFYRNKRKTKTLKPEFSPSFFLVEFSLTFWSKVVIQHQIKTTTWNDNRAKQAMKDNKI